jgi:hypothetical protein
MKNTFLVLWPPLAPGFPWPSLSLNHPGPLWDALMVLETNKKALIITYEPTFFFKGFPIKPLRTKTFKAFRA